MSMHLNRAMPTSLPSAPESHTDAAPGRQRRAYDTSPSRTQYLVESVRRDTADDGHYDYQLISVNPDPGKTVAAREKTFVPVDIGINIDSETYTESLVKACERHA